jgi:hypothetical protein
MLPPNRIPLPVDAASYCRENESSLAVYLEILLSFCLTHLLPMSNV